MNWLYTILTIGLLCTCTYLSFKVYGSTIKKYLISMLVTSGTTPKNNNGLSGLLTNPEMLKQIENLASDPNFGKAVNELMTNPLLATKIFKMFKEPDFIKKLEILVNNKLMPMSPLSTPPSSPRTPKKTNNMIEFISKTSNTVAPNPAEKVKTLLEQYEESNNSVIVPIIHKTSNPLDSLFGGSSETDTMICEKTYEKLRDLLIKTNGKDVDIIINTDGGSVAHTKQICNALTTYRLKNPNNKIKVHVPFKSMSGGTIISLMADELYMNDYAMLSPVDPQIGGLSKYGIDRILDKKTNGEGPHDITFYLDNTFKQNFELLERIFDNDISKVPKYTNDVNDLKTTLLSANRSHYESYNVEECGSIGIEISGTVSDQIMKVYEELTMFKIEKPNQIDSYRRMLGL